MKVDPQKSYGIFLPCVEERTSLLATMRILSEEIQSEHFFYVVTNNSKNRDDILAYLKVQFQHQNYLCEIQDEAKLAGAFKKGINLCKEAYFILMASDLETDPHLVKDMIKASSSNPQAIVTVSRWQKGTFFKGYGFMNRVANFLFQLLGRVIFRTSLSDLTFGYRIYPTSELKQMQFSQTNHAILLEALLIPLQNRYPVIEVPGSWTKRSEGSSKKEWKNNLSYLHLLLSGSRFYRCLLKLLLRPR